MKSFKTFIITYFNFMHVALLPACVSVCRSWIPWNCYFRYRRVGAGNRTHPLKEQTLILTANPSLQPIK